MRKRLRSTLAVLLACAVSGCTTYWSKPGATERDFAVDNTACASQAYQVAPVSNAPLVVGTGYAQPSFTTCSGTLYSANCITTGGNYVPPTVVPIDVNRNARTLAYESCMYGRGWSKTSEASPAQPAAATPVAMPAGHWCANETLKRVYLRRVGSCDSGDIEVSEDEGRRLRETYEKSLVLCRFSTGFVGADRTTADDCLARGGKIDGSSG